MMPKHIPPTDPLDRHMSLRTSDFLHKMIRNYQMEKQVLVVSRDGFKLLGLAASQPLIPMSWPIEERLYMNYTARAIENEYYDFPPVYKNECFKMLGSNKGFAFMKTLVSSGLISKVVNASFLDISMSIYEDSKYFDTSKQPSIKDVVHKNYGAKVSLGVFDVFSWNNTESSSSNDQKEDDKKKIEKIIAVGASHIITNNVNRVKRALDEVITPYSKGEVVHTYKLLTILTILLGKMIVTLVYL